jgi:putative transposase
MSHSDQLFLDPVRFPQRKWVRLKQHNYTAGNYFITLCTAGRRQLLGYVESATVVLTCIGKIVQDEWLRTGEIRPNVLLDSFIVMPDHFHAIITLGTQAVNESPELRAHAVRPYLPATNLARLIGGFKSACTRRYRDLLDHTPAALWQRGYYEHVIRGRPQLTRIRKYIAENPSQWQLKRSGVRVPQRVSATACNRSAVST